MCEEETAKRSPAVLVRAYLVSAREAVSWTPTLPLEPEKCPAIGSAEVGGLD